MHEQKARETLDRLVALWAMEQRHVRAEFEEALAHSTLAQRAGQGMALADVEVAESALAWGGRTLLWLQPRRDGDLEVFGHGPGAPVRLWWDKPTGPETVRGVLGRRRAGNLGVMVEENFPDRLLEGRFHLDLEPDGSTFRRGEQALRAFGQAKGHAPLGVLRDTLLGGRPQPHGRPAVWEAFDSGLNEAQRQAVGHALAAPVAALVHGPPGTGKTRTLVEIIRQLAVRDQRVLVAAASNAAVDNLAERLAAAGVEVVRVGHPARVSTAVEAVTLDARLEAMPEYGLARGWMQEANALRRRVDTRQERGNLSPQERWEMQGQMRRLFADARRYLRELREMVLGRAQVICATASGADSSLLDGQKFDVVVLDESTQLADPMALVALAKAPKAILAGDPCQLPPTVLCHEAGRQGLSTTILERLAGEAQLLVVQYRMHEHLMAFPSEAMYRGRLLAAPGNAGHLLEDLVGVAGDALRPGPLVFVDTAGKGWEEERLGEDRSTCNPWQADRTVREVRRLLSRGLPVADVGVITPYDAQARRLRDLLKGTGVEVNTVDAFQGREKEAVVVDLVRSNTACELGFLRDTRRMNVALTRARRFLLVIGDSATLGGHPFYAGFLQAVEVFGAWVSAWSDEAPMLGE